MDFIKLRGIKTHNLKNINIDLPKNKLIVITGVSGSGKSSLAFDTIYSEGKRRYVESLSSYTKQFFKQIKKPDFDLIEGLSPTISLQQRPASKNPRSTVGTVTEINDYLRLLFSKIGDPFCPDHKIKLKSFSVEQVKNILYTRYKNMRVSIQSSFFLNQNSNILKIINNLKSQGFIRVKIKDNVYDIDDINIKDLEGAKEFFLIVDRIIINEENRARLIDSLESAFTIGSGIIVIDFLKKNEELRFSSNYSCTKCNFSISNIEPNSFSFNDPKGACEECSGLGKKSFFDQKKIVAFPELSLASGAIMGFDKKNKFFFDTITSLSKHYDFNLDTPFIELDENIKKIILYGSGKQKINFLRTTSDGDFFKKESYEGIIPNLEKRLKNVTSEIIKKKISKYLSEGVCKKCQGTRLKIESRNILINNHSISQLQDMTISNLLNFFTKIILTKNKEEIALLSINEITKRLTFLKNVGLSYLSLNRKSNTLSGGETQRIKLASQIGSGLSGIIYVLDEPSIGLHPSDNDKLLNTLQDLKNSGNTVIIVEHDLETIKLADFIVDIGPYAGVGGGALVAYGQHKRMNIVAPSLTLDYLNGKRSINFQKLKKPKNFLEIYGANVHNLKNLCCKIPIGLLTCITGVSGSGKSTLTNEVLFKSLKEFLNNGSFRENSEKIIGHDAFNEVIKIDQSPIGKSSRSNPASYVGILPYVRDLLASTQIARERGYKSGRFSFNVEGGRCENCKGEGLKKIEMYFLQDTFIKCEYCDGERFNNQTLDIKYKGKNISDILSLTFDEAKLFFSNIPHILKKINVLIDVGLGYLKLGQPANFLSGGESQRLKLATELSKANKNMTLYILDEPTTGLHVHDVKLLLETLIRLRDSNNTLVIIEHNLDVIKSCDWIIDLGPGGGLHGGNVLFQGKIKEILSHRKSLTGKFLKKKI